MEMKKDKAIIVLIAIWQLFLAVYTTTVLVGVIIARFGSPGNYYSDMLPVFDWTMDIFVAVYSPVAIAVFIGLLLRKNWGRILSIFSSGLAALTVFLFLVFSFVATYWSLVHHFSINLIVPQLLMLTLILLSIFSYIYLKKPRVKILFKTKPALS
jgi:hypothetical protein